MIERKLTTILAADVVGYSRLMAHDEAIALELLKERRAVIDDTILEHNGSVFGSAGDSVIAQFDSPVNAVESAIKFQGKIHALNEVQSAYSNMEFRVGVNIGDVMVSDDNFYGDAVNIAARLEGVGIPGGICVAKTVVDMIAGKLKISFEAAGDLNLKNIDRAVSAFHVIPSKGATRYIDHSDAPKPNMVDAEPGSLAVMLFKSLSTDEEQEYFCEGFSEDLISSLSQFRKLLVMSGNASFSYRDSAKRPVEIGKELGVRYLLEGSVRKLGNRMRISTSLISTAQGQTVWSNKHDIDVNEIFDVQDDLIETIVSTIAGRVEADSVQKISKARPENLGAYDLVLKGLEYHRRSGISRENAEEAYELFDRAVQMEPNYARAYAWRACAMANVAEWSPQRLGEDWLQECINSVNQGLDLDPNDPEVHRILGAIKLVKGEFSAALHHHEKARELCPSDAYIIGRYATMLIYFGKPGKALEEINNAKRIDPFCPDFLFEDEGICHFWLSEFVRSVEAFHKLKVPTRNSLFYAAAAFLKIGEAQQASSYLSEAIAMSNLTVEEFLMTQKYQSEKYIFELRKIYEAVESSSQCI